MSETQRSIFKANENVLLNGDAFYSKGFLRWISGAFNLTNKRLIFSCDSFVMDYHHQDPLFISVSGLGPLSRLLIEHEDEVLALERYEPPIRVKTKFSVQNPQFWKTCIEGVRKRRMSEFWNDVMTGAMLSTTVMYDSGARIEGDDRVLERLHQKIPEVAKKLDRASILPRDLLGGTALVPRDFIDYFVVRGPNCEKIMLTALERLKHEAVLKIRHPVGIGESREIKTYSLN
jgi:hypothetical protein